MPHYLFLFSIGPVQSFIAQARKTQDLYAGSRILSLLAKAGLIAANPKEMIFPGNINAISIPNRFLCIIETNDPKEFGGNVERAVRNEWNRIADTVLSTNVKGIKEQIDGHLDLNWAFQDIRPDYSDYKEQYDKIERFLGAVKNARSFTQFEYQGQIGEKGRKCILDGERNVKFYRLSENETETNVLHRKLYVDSAEVKIFGNADENVITYLKLQAGEGLSAVSMAKRLFKETTRPKEFESTADIAIMHTIEEVKKYPEGVKLLDAFKSIGEKMNAQLYYEENHTTQYYNKQGINTGCLSVLREKQKELKKFAKSKGLELTKYYAIIDFDGDNMGKWLSGTFIDNPETNLKDFHKKLSERLAEFAKEAKIIVDKYGQTVYAGGDDFLGFVNLNYLFLALKELRNKFTEIVNNSLKTLGYLNSELSFSAGVCIAHYKEPLGIVLDKASAAQKTAKNKDKGNRNAFCIVASKHSGENHETFFKWGTSCINVENLERVKDELIKPKRFSNTFIKSLGIEFSRLAEEAKLLPNKDLLTEEVSRLLKRSFMGKKEDKEKESKDFAEVIMSIYDQSKSYTNFITALDISDFIHRLLSSDEEKAVEELQPQTI
ncbi:MAG: type III-B CRISPR-associated protein Cas10/Cmr2 [Sphingobacteriales bacterium]|nr:MAG: type III-B CRISPR-associated protein Cas10/Cmr2 [Sphingobacteriales bacterium]